MLSLLLLLFLHKVFVNFFAVTFTFTYRFRFCHLTLLSSSSLLLLFELSRNERNNFRRLVFIYMLIRAYTLYGKFN